MIPQQNRHKRGGFILPNLKEVAMKETFNQHSTRYQTAAG